MNELDYSGLRERMVRWQIENRGIVDTRVLNAMREIPRHLFVAEDRRMEAYEDHPIPIGHWQTISQPYMVACMSSLLCLTGSETVLEIGTGCGYQAAVLSRLAARVITLEIIPDLADLARHNLQTLHIKNVEVFTLDGSKGYLPDSPYQGIIVTAAPLVVPDQLLLQLSANSRLVIPVGPAGNQVLEYWQKSSSGEISSQKLFPVSFVPFRGAAGSGHDLP